MNATQDPTTMSLLPALIPIQLSIITDGARLAQNLSQSVMSAINKKDVLVVFKTLEITKTTGGLQLELGKEKVSATRWTAL